MKSTSIWILLMISFLPVQVFANQALYSALSSEEKSLPADRMQLRYEKAVGGLTCIHSNHIVNGDRFSCSLVLSQANSEAIFSALNVEEITLPASRDTLVFQKTSGPLTCQKRSVFRRGTSFDCILSF